MDQDEVAEMLMVLESANSLVTIFSDKDFLKEFTEQFTHNNNGRVANANCPPGEVCAGGGLDWRGIWESAIVGGFIGGATGAYAGATAGTVAFPIVGTVTGGVSAAAIGFAGGFISGAGAEIARQVIFD